MGILDVFKVGKKETVETIDAKLMSLATERQAISDRRETLIELIASAYGMPEGEAAEVEYSRTEARLQALIIIENNLRKERQAAENRAFLDGYRKQVGAIRTTYEALQKVEQGDNGLLAIEKRYHQLLADSKRLRHSLHVQSVELPDARAKQSPEITASIEAINAENADILGMMILPDHQQALRSGLAGTGL